MASRFNWMLVVCSLTVLFQGCGERMPTTIKVTTEITLDGQPLPNAKVTFMPIDGRRSANGVSNAEGMIARFSSFANGDGVVPGEHWIAVTPKLPPPMPGQESFSPDSVKGAKPEGYTPPFPDRYGKPEESGLTAKVEVGGDNSFKFELKTD